MENKNYVLVKNMTNHGVSVSKPELGFRREWGGNMTQKIDRETLEQLMFDNGFNYMIQSGMLYIEDMEVKKELGIEPDDAIEPVNVIVLTDAERKEFLTSMSLATFKERCAELPATQLNSLVEYAIENKLMDLGKSRYLKNRTGRDIIKSIELQDTGEDEAKEG